MLRVFRMLREWLIPASAVDSIWRGPAGAYLIATKRFSNA
jgi:hypothetical protein